MSGDATRKFELWKVGTGYTFFAQDNEKARSLLNPGAKLAWTVEASCRTEAQAKMFEYFGWRPRSRPAD
jgi:hypothetical protein